MYYGRCESGEYKTYDSVTYSYTICKIIVTLPVQSLLEVSKYKKCLNSVTERIFMRSLVEI